MISAVEFALVIALVQLLLTTVANVWLKLNPATSCWVDALAVHSLSLAVKCAQLVTILPIVIGFAIVGLCGGRYFMKKLLDKLQIRPQDFAREDFKDCYSHYTGMKFSKREAEAAKAYLQGWLHQTVSHIAADRSLHYDTVCRHKLSSVSDICSCLDV